jgi:hypothetical protein
MPEKRNDWYYWSKNKYVHFIVWRDRDDQVAQAIIRSLSDAECQKAWLPYGSYEWRVSGPCWSTYEATGTPRTLDEAKQAVDQRVMAIIADEFRPEFIPPLG